MRNHIINIEQFKDFQPSVLMACDSKSAKKLLMVIKTGVLYPDGEYIIHYQIWKGIELIDEGYDLQMAIDAYNLL